MPDPRRRVGHPAPLFGIDNYIDKKTKVQNETMKTNLYIAQLL
jgi:hypothetical protein